MNIDLSEFILYLKSYLSVLVCLCVCVLQADSKYADYASKRPESDNGRAASSSLVAEVRYADPLKPLL